jgi:hypothetical protein
VADNLLHACCVTSMKPATVNEATAPAPVWRQAGESTFLPIDHLKVKIPKAPSACPQEIGAPNWNERWIPDLRTLRPLIVIGMLLTAFGFGGLGGFDSYWPPDSRPQEPTAEAAIDAHPRRRYRGISSAVRFSMCWRRTGRLTMQSAANQSPYQIPC